MTLPRALVVLGTRPESIKLAPVIHELRRRSDRLETLVVATAQHRAMLDQALELFRIVPDRDLDLMRSDQSLGDLTRRVLGALDGVLTDLRPDLLIVQGDTTSAFAAALAAFYRQIAVAHVEAGLRSYDPDDPFPEETNRRLLSVLASIHLAPTPLARQRLLDEGHRASRIVVTGNPVVDALAALESTAVAARSPRLADLPLSDDERLILVTSHRRESWGAGLESICLALRDLAQAFPDVRIVFPVHPNPNVRREVHASLEAVERVHLLEPLDYGTFLRLMQRAWLILTDSGGVAEEAPSFGKPVLLLRRITERPEALDAGLARLVGTSRRRIVAETRRLLTSPDAYRAMIGGSNPYGDGRAAGRIADAVCRWLEGHRPLLEPGEEFRQPAAGEMAE